ncbi:hypothetical protein DPMN_022101 [Dreissena polymorpha]|uniref:Uncharacterized protein n=1 Tax=Dreissena polymorpha TaxID=45954 RepID=A0A9D4NLY6_DREPO|nr:hypothetical protein DPMN_022101 [Dreissena polymorpha]
MSIVTVSLHRRVDEYSGVFARSSIGGMRLQVQRLLRRVRQDHLTACAETRTNRTFHVPPPHPSHHV